MAALLGRLGDASFRGTAFGEGSTFTGRYEPAVAASSGKTPILRLASGGDPDAAALTRLGPSKRGA
jgi:hypothetical protein